VDTLRGGQDRVDTETLPLRDAARRLGVSVESLRKRAQRGTIAAQKVRTMDGETWYVSVPMGGRGQDKTGQDVGSGQDGNGQDSGQPSPLDTNTAEIIAVLREQLVVKDVQIHHLMQIIAVQSANTLPSGERAQEGAEPAGASREDDSPPRDTNAVHKGAGRSMHGPGEMIDRVRRWWQRG